MTVLDILIQKKGEITEIDVIQEINYRIFILTALKDFKECVPNNLMACKKHYETLQVILDMMTYSLLYSGEAATTLKTEFFIAFKDFSFIDNITKYQKNIVEKIDFATKAWYGKRQDEIKL